MAAGAAGDSDPPQPSPVSAAASNNHRFTIHLSAGARQCINHTMSLDPQILEIIACPKCKGSLELKPDNSALLCHACRLAYPVVDDIPNLITDDAKAIES